MSFKSKSAKKEQEPEVSLEEHRYLEIVLSSRDNTDAGTTEAASEAMTELVRRGFNFSKYCPDLHGITIPGAVLDGAQLTGVNLSSSDLKGVSLVNSQCVMTNFDGCDMEGVRFDQEESYGIREDDAIIVCSPLRPEIIIMAYNKFICLFNRDDKTYENVFVGHNSSILGLKHARSGSRLISYDRKFIFVWDLEIENKRLLHKIAHQANLHDVAINKNAKVIAHIISNVSVSNGDMIYLCDLNESPQLSQFPSRTHEARIVLSFAKPFIFVGDHSKISRWNIVNHELQSEYILEKKSSDDCATVSLLEVSPNDKCLIVVTNNNGIQLFDIDGARRTLTYKRHKGVVDQLVVSANNRHIISSDSRGSIHVWYMENGELYNSFGRLYKSVYAYSREVKNLTYCKLTNTIYSFSRDKLTLWNVRESNQDAVVYRRGYITVVTLSSDGKYIADGNSLGQAYLRGTDGKFYHAYQRHDSRVVAMQFSPDATQLVTADSAYQIYLWNVHARRYVYKIPGHEKGEYNFGNMLSLAFNHDGTKIVSGGEDCTVRVWNTETGACDKKYSSLEDFVVSVQFNTDGSKIYFSCYDGSFYKIELGVGFFSGPHGMSNYIYVFGHNMPGAISRDGNQRAIICRAEQKIIYINEEDEYKVQELTVALNYELWPELSVIFSHSGRYLAVSDAENSYLWDLRSMGGPMQLVGAQSLDIQGDLLVMAIDDGVYLFNILDFLGVSVVFSTQPSRRLMLQGCYMNNVI